MFRKRSLKLSSRNAEEIIFHADGRPMLTNLSFQYWKFVEGLRVWRIPFQREVSDCLLSEIESNTTAKWCYSMPLVVGNNALYHCMILQRFHA